MNSAFNAIRFAKVVAELKLTRTELALLFGWTESSLARIRDGKIKTVSSAGIQRIISLDSDILAYVFQAGEYQKEQKEYLASEDVRLRAHKVVGEIRASSKKEVA